MRVLEKQLALQRDAFGVDPYALTGEARADYIRWNALAAIKELTEALDEVDGWKPWQTERENAGEFHDRSAFIDELVDVQHFLANLLLAAGADDITLEYHFNVKQAVNAARQATGYAGKGDEWPGNSHPMETGPARDFTKGEARQELLRVRREGGDYAAG